MIPLSCPPPAILLLYLLKISFGRNGSYLLIYNDGSSLGSLPVDPSTYGFIITNDMVLGGMKWEGKDII